MKEETLTFGGEISCFRRYTLDTLVQCVQDIRSVLEAPGTHDFLPDTKLSLVTKEYYEKLLGGTPLCTAIELKLPVFYVLKKTVPGESPTQSKLKNFMTEDTLKLGGIFGQYTNYERTINFESIGYELTLYLYRSFDQSFSGLAYLNPPLLNQEPKYRLGVAKICTREGSKAERLRYKFSDLALTEFAFDNKWILDMDYKKYESSMFIVKGSLFVSNPKGLFTPFGLIKTNNINLNRPMLYALSEEFPVLKGKKFPGLDKTGLNNQELISVLTTAWLSRKNNSNK